MSNYENILNLNIQLFADGASASSASADSGTSGDEGTSGVTGGASLPSRKNANPLANVVYGKQAEGVQTATVQEKTEPEIDRNAEFEKIIKGEYKDLYNKRVQDTVQKRLKATKETVDKYNSLVPALETLSRKYGVDATDVNALSKAIEEDSSYYEQEAVEKGISVEQLKEIKRLEKENSQFKAERAAAERQAEIDRDIAQWMQDAEVASKTFPGLDLGVELQNEQFVGLLKMGVDMGTAYFAIHHKELVPQAMQYTAKEVENKLAKKIIAGGQMPTQNGTANTASSVVKSDVSQLTKADRAEINRRVARGEKITF